jgi:hypothetical protein
MHLCIERFPMDLINQSYSLYIIPIKDFNIRNV